MAKEIWKEHYTPIIGGEQVDYMLERFQSKKAISVQIREGVVYFLIGAGTKFIGYMAVQPKGPALFLSKIYVGSSKRTMGYGSQAVIFIEDLARRRGLGLIYLTVNKNNTASLRFYEKLGFRNLGSVVQDIGGGFVMDDYKMGKYVSMFGGAGERTRVGMKRDRVGPFGIMQGGKVRSR